MEFSRANFEFFKAKQNEYSHKKINGIEKNTSNHQFIEMIKLEPNQCQQLEKIGFIQDEQSQNKEYQLKVLGIAKALKLQFQITSHTVMDVLVKFQNDHSNYSDSVFDNIKQFLGTLYDFIYKQGEEDEFAHNKPLDIDDSLSLFKVCFESIQIFGYKLSYSPPASHGVTLLNLSNIFRKHNRIEEAVETELLSGFSFMNSRKFLQASEIFIKASKFYKDKYLQSISKNLNAVFQKKNKFLKDNDHNGSINHQLQIMNVGQQIDKLQDVLTSTQCRNSLKQHFQLFQSVQSFQPFQLRTSSSVQGQHFLATNLMKNSLLDGTLGQNQNATVNDVWQQTLNKNLLKAAKLELLAADSIVQPSMINQKVAAYCRAVDCFTNMSDDFNVNINNNFDTYSALLRICPYLCKLAIKCLSDKQENVQVAAIKTLEFLVEQLGCTLGNQLQTILVSVFTNYPIQKEEGSILKQFDMDSDDEDDEDDKINFSGVVQTKGEEIYKSKSQNEGSSKKNKNEDLENEIFEDEENIDENEEEEYEHITKNSQLKKEIILEEEKLDEAEFIREKDLKKAIQLEHEKTKKQKKQNTSTLETLSELRKKMQEQSGNFVSQQSFQHIQDSYHHFLETFINVLASASSQILRVIFQEIISFYILLRDLNPDLRIYVFRIAEKILAICQGDVEIETSFFHYMLYAIDGSGYENFYTEQQVTNIQYYALKLWETIKLKLVYNMDIVQLNGVINWVAEMLVALLEAEQEGQKKDIQSILNKVYQLLDLITIITIRYHSNRKIINPNNIKKNDSYYIKQEEVQLDKQNNADEYVNLNNLVDNQEDDTSDQVQPSKKNEKGEEAEDENNIILKYYKKINQNVKLNNKNLILINSPNQINVDNLIKPLILWIENSLQYQSQIDIFKNIWLVMVEIIPEESEINLFDIAYPLLERVAEFLFTSSPPPLMLEFIKIIISSLPKLKQNSQQDIVQFIIQFFIIFCDSIPHSVNDESFQIFDILLYITQLHLTPELIQKCLMSLIDKFTMKGKAQKRSIELFKRIVSSRKNINSFRWLLEICLINNQEPELKYDLNQNEIKNNKNKLYKKQNKQNDTKYFNNSYDLFQEKIQFLSEVFCNLQLYHFENLKELFLDNTLSISIIRILNSGNSKMRIKGINLAKLLLEQYLKAFASKIIKIKNSSQTSNIQIKLNSNKTINFIFNNLKKKYLKKLLHSKNFLTKSFHLNQSKGDQKTSDTIRKSSTVSQDRESEDPEYFQNIFKADNPEIQFIDEIQILMIRFQLQITKVPFLQEIQDNKLLFNSLIILDLLFQTIFCGPSIQNELENFIKNNKPDMYQSFFNQNKEDSTNKSNNIQNQQNVQSFQLKSEQDHIELQNLIINQSTKFIRTSQVFQELRIQEILQIIPLVQNFLHSPWSNIRSLTYGLLCYWVKPNIGNYKMSLQKKFANLILDIIESLLINQESECRTGGLNIIGSFCGLGYNFDSYGEKMQELLEFFRQSENIIPTRIWKAVYKIQFDWDSTNQAAALALVQLCAPRIKIKKFYYQSIKSTQSGQDMINQVRRYSKQSGSSQVFYKRDDSFFSIPNILNKDEENSQNQQKRIYSAQQLGSKENMQKFGKLFATQQNNESYKIEINSNQSLKNQEELLNGVDEDAKIESRQEQQRNQIQKQADSTSYLHNNEEDDENDKYLELEELNNIFWVEYLNSKDIRDYISMFRNEYKPPSTLWIERVNYNNEEEMEQAFQEQQQAIQLSEDTDLLLIQQNARNSQIQQQQQKQNQQASFIQKTSQSHQLGQYIDQDIQFQQAGGLKAYCDENKEQNNHSKNNNNHRYKLDDDQLELEELGIIEANEDDWNEGEENRILMNAHKAQDGIHNIQSGKKEKDIKKASTKQQNASQKEQINKNYIAENIEINKKGDEKSKKQILLSDSRFISSIKYHILQQKKQQDKQKEQKQTQGEKTQLFQNFLGQISPRDIEHQKNQQTFPTDDDELEEDVIDQDLVPQVEQNYDINFGTHETEQSLEEDVNLQNQQQQSNSLLSKQIISQAKQENKKRQTNILPTIESEEEFVSNQNNQSHETEQYLQSLINNNSNKANKSKNIESNSSKISADDLIKQKDNDNSQENSQNKSSERAENGKVIQKLNTVKKNDEQLKQEQINSLSDRITQVSKQNNSLSDRGTKSNKQNNSLSQRVTQANSDLKSNQKIENEKGQSQQRNEEQSNKVEKVFNINSLLLQAQDKEYMKQKMYQDQKQQLLKQGKTNNKIQIPQQQYDQNKNNGNNNINQINLQQQILLQQQLLLDAQQKTQQIQQAILIDDYAINKQNKSNDKSQKNHQEISQDSISQENLGNSHDQIYQISKTFEDNDMSQKQQNSKGFDTTNSNDSQQSYQLATTSQSNKSQDQQKVYWDNISFQLQQQSKQQNEHPIQFSFQNSNADSLQSSAHPSALFSVVKKDDDQNNNQQSTQMNPKIFHSFAMQTSMKSEDQNAAANMFFPNESSQFQSAEFERSSDTEIDENSNNFQQVTSARIGKSVNEDEKVNTENEKSQCQNSIQQNNQLNLQDSDQINNSNYNESFLFNDKLIKYNSDEYSKEMFLQQITSFQNKRNPISYTQSSEDQVILESNQTLDRPTSKEKSSKINLVESFNSTSKYSGGQSSEGLIEKQKKSQNMIGEVLEESKFTPSNNSGLIPTIKKKIQKKDYEGDSVYFREGDSSRNNKKEEGIIEEFLTEEESSTEEQVQVKLKQRYASEPMALQPIYPLSSTQSPSILIQKSEEYYGRQKKSTKKGAPVTQVQSSESQQQYQSIQPTTIASTKNDISDPNLGSTKNTKRSGNKSKDRSNSPKHKKTSASKKAQLNQINNLQMQQQQIVQQQLLQITQNQQPQQYQFSQQHTQQPQSQPQYYTSENLTAFQTPLIQKSLTPNNRAKEIAFRRNSNSSQKGIGGQSTNGENYTSKKRLNMNENNVNQYMNNSNSKHNKTCESGSNSIGGKYYKSIGYKLLTKNHSTNNIFNTSSLINTTQNTLGSTSFNNGSAANLALSQLQNNTSSTNQNSAINKINNQSKDKLIKKLMTNKGLNASELKSVIKLHQQTQLFFNQTQPNQLQQQFMTISGGDSKHRTRLSKSPSKKSRISSHDSGDKNKKRQSKSSSPFNERIELSPADKRDIYPHSLHISYNNQNLQKNSKYSQFSNNYNQNVTNFDIQKNMTEVLNSSNRKSKKGDYPKSHHTHQNYHIHHPLNPIYWQEDEQQLKQNQITMEETNNDNTNLINLDELPQHHFFFEQQDSQGEQFYNNFKNEQFINKKGQPHLRDQHQPNFQRESLNQQGRSYSSGKIKQAKSKKQRSKEPLMLNENHIGIAPEQFFSINMQKNKDRPNSNEKELSVSLATSTKNNNINLKSKKSLPLNISGFVQSQQKNQPNSTTLVASSLNPHQQVEKLLTTTKTGPNKNSSKKQKTLSKSKSKKEIVMLQNISSHLQQNNTQLTNNTSAGYSSSDLLGYKSNKKYEPASLSSQKNKKVKGEQNQNMSTQLKILQASSKQQTSLPSNDSYLPFDNQQQFFKTPSNSNIKNSNFNEFMKNAYQNNAKELLDDLNQTL